MNFIKEMLLNGKITVSEAAEDEFNDELEGIEEEPSDDELEADGIEEIEEVDLEGDGIDDSMDIEEPVEEVKRIHTIDTISQLTNKFDTYMASANLDWMAFINNGRIKRANNMKFIEDMRTILNKTLDEKKFRYVEIYNKLYDFLTDKNITTGLNMFGRENFGKPYIAEGLALLMYELSAEWVPVLTRYYKENPVFNDSIKPEQDSFFTKFPMLNLYSYIAAIVTENKEFKKLINSDKSRKLLKDEGNYQLTATQAKKKPNLYAIAGESLSYYASLVKEDFGDITAGILDKLAYIAFIHSNTQFQMNDRLKLIERLINVVTTEVTQKEMNGTDPLTVALDTLNSSCTDFLKDRSDAKITLEADEKNYPIIINNGGI